MTVFLALVLSGIFFFYFSIGQNRFTYLDDTAIMAEANYSDKHYEVKKENLFESKLQCKEQFSVC